MPDFIDYLNGEFLPHSQCMISVGDRGFGGDAVFDVERTFDGKIFKLEDKNILQKNIEENLLEKIVIFR